MFGEGFGRWGCGRGSCWCQYQYSRGTQGMWLEEEEFGLDIIHFRYPQVFQDQVLRAGGCTLGAW